MPADVPFNLDDLDPDARAMAEAAAKAAGISVSEWVSRIVLARAGLAAPDRAIPAHEPSQPTEPPEASPSPDASAEDTDQTSRTVPAQAGKDNASAAPLDASSTVTVTRAAPAGSAHRQAGTTPLGASARQIHAPLSVGTDSTTIVIKRSVAADRPKARDAAPVAPAAERSPAAEADASGAQPMHAVDTFEAPVSMASIEGQGDTRPFLADPLSAPENEEPLREADRPISATAPAPSEETAAGAMTGGSTDEEPIDPSLAATSPERISDLSDLSVDTDIGGTDLPSGRRRALLLGSVALSLVAAAIWFSFAPVFESGSEAPFRLPSLLSALKVPAEEKSSPSSPDETTTSPPATDAPSAAAATPAAPPSAASEPSQQLAALRALAESGDGTAQHDLAVRYARGDGTAPDYREAARWFRAAALQGVANAQYNIGVLTERGLGVEANPPMALLWYLAAAGKGHSAAEYNIGLIYAEGKGVDVNPTEAMKWFQRAAERGFARAQYNLGVMHERGVENRIDLIEAYRWYRIAAAGGDSGAEIRLAEIKGRMSPGEIVKAEELARQPLNPSKP
jgi:TPR repeat protein